MHLYGRNQIDVVDAGSNPVVVAKFLDFKKRKKPIESTRNTDIYTFAFCLILTFQNPGCRMTQRKLSIVKVKGRLHLQMIATCFEKKLHKA